MKPNTLHQGDCLGIMGEWPAGAVDLIYLDPPYGSQRDYGQFDDRWPSFEAYLDYMRPRLEQCHRLLKPTGSLYLHCDPTASHYLKVMLDGIFGRANFQNEIAWERTYNVKTAGQGFARSSDRILVYAATKATFNHQYRPMAETNRAAYRGRDADGRIWRRGVVHNPRLGGYHYSLELGEVIPKNGYRMSEQTARRWLAEDRLIVKPGRQLAVKCYLKDSKGSLVTDFWDDLVNMGGTSKERVGYPTQKPLALLERIIKASSNEGDLVLDPFCGSGTTIIAAAKLGRQWIGIDQNPDALAIVKQRLNTQTMPLIANMGD